MHSTKEGEVRETKKVFLLQDSVVSTACMRPCGWLLLEKPVGLSSAAALAPLRRFFGIKRVGHSGTLDPFASGLLVICFGRATRLLAYTKDWLKEYVFEIYWGVKTDTADCLGKKVLQTNMRPTTEEIKKACKRFLGAIQQRPHPFSAVKVQGRRAYVDARKGIDVVLEKRTQHIHALEVLEERKDTTRLRVVCDTGTYIRVLAEDLAASLGAVAHVSCLKRTRVGQWSLSHAVPLDFFRKTTQDERISLQDTRTLLDDIPAVAVSYKEACRLIQGQEICGHAWSGQRRVFCIYRNMTVALVEKKDGCLWPVHVFEDIIEE